MGPIGTFFLRVWGVIAFASVGVQWFGFTRLGLRVAFFNGFVYVIGYFQGVSRGLFRLFTQFGVGFVNFGLWGVFIHCFENYLGAGRCLIRFVVVFVCVVRVVYYGGQCIALF